jgi:1,4-alpha-glucan branching enzyme
VRYTFSRYHYVLGGEDDTHRFAVGVTWRFGGGETEARLAVTMTQPLATPRAGQPWRFRLRAPGAQRVALVGDFNAWDPQAQPLRLAGDGWWEIETTLPAGSYLYAYWVDGVLVTPPDAQRSVDDGFGGRNGLHEVSR